jgi:cell division protein FtsL
MVAACVAAGELGAYSHERNIVEVYYKEITVIEDIVFRLLIAVAIIAAVVILFEYETLLYI